jgi:hypothetical protein
MDLIPRYLQAVRFWLPKKQQDDIIAEISQDIRDQVEECESATGHTLTEAETEALLRRRGSPLLVANKYLPQDTLIGPLLFPLYKFVIKVVTACILVPMVLGQLILLLGGIVRTDSTLHGLSWIGQAVSHLWIGWFAAMGSVTLVFAILDRTQARQKLLDSWNPRRLPPVRPAHLIPRSSSAIEMAVNLSVLLWWIADLFPPLTLHFGTLHIALTSAWAGFFWSGLILTGVNAAFAAENLVQPYWTTEKLWVRFALDVAGTVFFSWLLRANLVRSMVSPDLSLDQAAAMTHSVNLWIGRMFPYAVAVGILVAGGNLWRLLRLRKKIEAPRLRPAPVA